MNWYLESENLPFIIVLAFIFWSLIKLALRGIYTWFFKIDEVLKNQEEIKQILKKIEDKK